MSYDELDNLSFEEAMKYIDETINSDWHDSSQCDKDMARDDIASLVIKHWKELKGKLSLKF